MGAGVARPEDLPGALRRRREELWGRPCEPVAVSWDGRGLTLRIRSAATASRAAVHLHLESGDEVVRVVDLSGAPVVEAAEVEGVRRAARQIVLEERLPHGYHRARVELERGEADVLVVSAPRRVYPGSGEREWGVFAPLYALHSRQSWGVGDLGDLGDLLEWVGCLEGNVVATLPLLAAFLDEPFEPSPYSPASRLLFNELYLDPRQIPELEACPEARELAGSPAFGRKVSELAGAALVDYRETMALKRRVLERLAACFFTSPGRRREDLRRFVERHPHAADYARFRAAGERFRAPWPAWPEPARSGSPGDGDAPEEARRYHLYVQFLLEEQLERLAERGRDADAGLMLDLPLGVLEGSYDVWREREAFLAGVSVGCPADYFNPRGQDWGFPPMHPERIREQGYRYHIACLQNLMRRSRVLRIDHVMGMHRLFVVPAGMAAARGTYVRYRPEELYAILALESHRAGCAVVGEDLGTVPSYVRAAMARHGLQRTYVLQFQLRADPHAAIEPVLPGAAVAVNTHDMVPFAAFWSEEDVAERLSLGLLTDAQAAAERRSRGDVRRALVAYLRQRGGLRDAGPGTEGPAVLRSCLAELAASESPLLIVNLEDLWWESRSHNFPGLTPPSAYPNWQGRSRHGLEQIRTLPAALDTLQEVARLRRPGRGDGKPLRIRQKRVQPLKATLGRDG